MSTTTDQTPDALAIDLRNAETAPSQTMVEGPGFARIVGFVGLFALVLGSVVIITNMALTPRWITTGWGYLFAAFGIVLLMYHAVSDTEPEVRRMYGLFSAILLVLCLLVPILLLFNSPVTSAAEPTVACGRVSIRVLAVLSKCSFVANRRVRSSLLMKLLLSLLWLAFPVFLSSYIHA